MANQPPIPTDPFEAIAYWKAQRERLAYERELLEFESRHPPKIVNKRTGRSKAASNRRS